MADLRACIDVDRFGFAGFAALAALCLPGPAWARLGSDWAALACLAGLAERDLVLVLPLLMAGCAGLPPPFRFDLRDFDTVPPVAPDAKDLDLLDFLLSPAFSVLTTGPRRVDE